MRGGLSQLGCLCLGAGLMYLLDPDQGPRRRARLRDRLANALSGFDLKSLTAAGAGRQPIDVVKAVTVEAPADRVFEFWNNFENFPRFMTHVREVRDLGDGRFHWVVAGPAGTPVCWDAALTEHTPNEVIAWTSDPGSVIANSGAVHFEPVGPNCTRVSVHLSYQPPAGALGHLAARLFGADPESAMDADLLRFKALIEENWTREARDIGRRRRLVRIPW